MSSFFAETDAALRRTASDLGVGPDGLPSVDVDLARFVEIRASLIGLLEFKPAPHLSATDCLGSPAALAFQAQLTAITAWAAGEVEFATRQLARGVWFATERLDRATAVLEALQRDLIRIDRIVYAMGKHEVPDWIKGPPAP